MGAVTPSDVEKRRRKRLEAAFAWINTNAGQAPCLSRAELFGLRNIAPDRGDQSWEMSTLQILLRLGYLEAVGPMGSHYRKYRAIASIAPTSYEGLLRVCGHAAAYLRDSNDMLRIEVNPDAAMQMALPELGSADGGAASAVEDVTPPPAESNSDPAPEIDAGALLMLLPRILAGVGQIDARLTAVEKQLSRITERLASLEQVWTEPS